VIDFYWYNASTQVSVCPDAARPTPLRCFSVSWFLKKKQRLAFSIVGIASRGQRTRPPWPSPERRCRTQPLPALLRTQRCATPPSRIPLPSISPVAKAEAGEACACTCACIPIHLAPLAERGGLRHRNPPPSRSWLPAMLCFKCFRHLSDML
jgi:hypothetical protein